MTDGNFLAECLPIESPWVTRTGAKCIQRDVYSITLAVVNILTDVLTLLIPFFIFLGLKVNPRVRSALLTVFLLGIRYVDPRQTRRKAAAQSPG